MNIKLILEAYGFAEEEKQQAIMKLMIFAGAFEPTALGNDLRLVDFEPETIALVKRHLSALIDASSSTGTIQSPLFTPVESWWPLLNNVSALLDFSFPELRPGVPVQADVIFNWFIFATQKYLFMRAEHQERWDMLIPTWIKENFQAITQQVTKTALLQEQLPQHTIYDAIIILGATGPVMEQRIEFCKRLVEERGIQASNIYLLSSTRQLERWEKDDMSPSFNAEQEGALLQQLFESKKGSGTFARIPLQVFIAPYTTLSYRPTRTETLAYLFEVKKEDILLTDNARLLYISSTPELLGQEADIRANMADYRVQAEVAGYAIEPTDPHVLLRAVSTLGGFFYSEYGRVAKNLSLRLKDNDKLAYSYLARKSLQQPSSGWSPMGEGAP